MPKEEEITDEQAEEALRALTTHDDGSEPEATEDPAAPQAAEPSAPAGEEETPAEGEPVSEAAAAEEDEGDDVQSLRARVKELEGDREADTARMEAQNKRAAENERILRDRFLRKSTAADRALDMLEKAKSDDGASPADVDKVIQEIRGTNHPSSARYAQPEPAAAEATTEDQALIYNTFLNGKGMSDQDQQDFEGWLAKEGDSKLSAAEKAVAADSLYGFFEIAYSRMGQDVLASGKDATRSDAVEAVRSVQRTQRQAARAASGTPTTTKKQPAEPTETKAEDLTPQDVSDLMKLSVTQYN